MMEAILPRSWKEQFALAAAIRQEDILYREKLARFDARQRQITEEQRIATLKSDAQAWAAFEAALAPPAHIADFRSRLVTYDTKTVEALIDNQEALDRVRERLDDLLGKAHVLPDGRRVFKTMDGQRVFDEHGQEMKADAVDPSSIDDRKPRWETFKADVDERRRLVEERQGLIDYQAKLDETRDRLDKGDITNGDLDDMKGDLERAMPDTVRRKLGMEGENRTTAPAAAGPSEAMPDGMDALMRQTGLSPSPMAGPR